MMRTRRWAAWMAVVIAGILLTGCSVFTTPFLEAIKATPHVASVESRGGGYSDSEWIAKVVPESGLTDDEKRELLLALTRIKADSDEATPELVLALGRESIVVPLTQAEAVERFDAWAAHNP